MRETPQDLEAKEKLVTAMLSGCPWEDAACWAGVQTTRSTAYRWRHAYVARGEEALHDGRHGHPRKLRGAERAWVEAYCRGAPDTPSRVVQAALVERCGVQVTVTHLNRIRAALGVSRRTAGGGEKGGGDRPY